MAPALKRLCLFSIVILIGSLVYYGYLVFVAPPNEHKETFMTEIGEGVGEVALWAFVAIYLRTLVKLVFGRGPLSRRLLPDYQAPTSGTMVKRMIAYLDQTHVYLGVASVALVLIHILLVGLYAQILFFPIVLALVVWQAVFGFLISWKGSPKNLKRWSYSVHAQLVTGVAIGVLAYFGHMVLEVLEH